MSTRHDDGTYVVHLTQTVHRARPRWEVEGYYRGHRVATRARATSRDERAATAAADSLWRAYLAGHLTAPDAPPATVTELVDRFCTRTVTKKGRPLSPATLRAYRSQLAGLVAAAGPECPVGHLHERHVRAHVLAPALAPRTRDQYLRATRALVRWAMTRRWLGVDVTAAVDVDPGPPGLRPYLMPHELPAFLDGCSPSHRIRAAFIIETGLRAGEAAALRWAWVRPSLAMTTIYVPASDPASGFVAKGRRGRTIPLSQIGLQALDAAREKWGSEGFVLHAREQPPLTTNWCADTHTACRRGGVTDTDTHGLRRTAGCMWLAAGVDLYTVKTLLGHASITTTEKAYADVLDGRLAEAVRQVDAARATTTPLGGAPSKPENRVHTRVHTPARKRK